MLRVILEPEPLSGARNMATDEVLLESAIERDVASLRVYAWREPTVSLGYFQSTDDPVLRERFAALAQVRRLSGGGAILHHHEITYSFTLPPSHALAEDPIRLYDAAHAAIVAMLNDWGVPAQLRGQAKGGEQPFLCFGRGDIRDIVLTGSKIVGSAQRRRKGAVLQHGALLLERSPHAPEFPGLFDLSGGTRREVPDIAAAMTERLSQCCEDDCERMTLTPEEQNRALEWAATRYATTQSFVQRNAR